MGSCKPMYGFDGKQTENLRTHFRKLEQTDHEWSCVDDFIRWARESGYKTGKHLRKHDEALPHGPNNSFWMSTDKNQARNRYMRRAKDTCKFCKDCSKECSGDGLGCKEWKNHFVNNWNKNIRVAKPEPVDDPSVKKYFRYEHPDLVREGIVFHAER